MAFFSDLAKMPAITDLVIAYIDYFIDLKVEDSLIIFLLKLKLD